MTKHRNIPLKINDIVNNLIKKTENDFYLFALFYFM